MKQFFIIIIIPFAFFKTYAATHTWKGNTNTLWSVKTNWNTGTAPSIGDDVIIEAGSNNCVVDKNIFDLNSILIQGGHLTISPGIEVSVSGNKQRAVQVSSGGILIINGLLAIVDHSGNGLHIASGTVTNNNILNIDDINSGSGGTGKGLYNEGTFTNNDEVVIDDTDDLGIENITTFNNNGDIVVKNLNGSANGIYNEGTMYNNAGDDIDITNVPGTKGIDNQGVFNNSGTIDIKNLPNGIGIYSSDLFNNSNTIKIDNVKFIGIDNTNDFNHISGMITITNLDNNNLSTETVTGIRSSHSFVSNSNTAIIMNTFFASGSVVHACGIDNSATFTSNGTISIDSIRGGTACGILNDGTFSVLNNTINIDRMQGGWYSYGIQNKQSFSIETDAKVYIRDTELTISTFSHCYGIWNTEAGSTFNNFGTIEILETGRHGIYNDQIFNNHDSIKIIGFAYDNGFHAGIHNNHTFENKNDGYIYLDDNGASECPNPTCPFSQGIANNMTFNNLGTIVGTNLFTAYEGQILNNSGEMSFFEAAVINHNTLTNSGLLHIKEAKYGIQNKGTIVNESNGHIFVDSTSNSYGILNEPDKIINNEGKITLKKIHQSAISNHGMIINSDTIKIDTCFRTGIGTGMTSNIVADTSLINNNDGVILISYMPDILQVDHALEVESKIVNRGEIKIEFFKNIDPAISNSGIIENWGTLATDNHGNANSNNNFTSLLNIAGAVFFNVAGSIVDFKTGYVNNLGKIINNGRFEISDNFSLGLTNNDTLINNFTLICNNYSTLVNNAYIENNYHFEFYNSSITNHSKLVNNDDIKLIKGGVSNQDTLINSSSSVIEADTVLNQGSWGLQNTPDSYVSNKGHIIIKNVESGGIENRGFIKLFPSASLVVINSPRQSIVNYDSIFTAHGSITSVDTITTTDAISNYGNWLNEGEMKVSNCRRYSLVNNNKFENKGLVTFNEVALDSSFSTAIKNSGKFTNLSSAQIIIQNIFGVSSAMENSGTFINQNEIFMNRLKDNGISNSGTFHNFHEIIIQESLETGLNNSASFTNYAGSHLTIRNFSNSTFSKRGVLNSGNFVNDGYIDIEKILNPSLGIAFENRGTFTHNDTLVIELAKTGFSNSSTTPFVNNGVIKIKEAQSFGLRSTHHFTNANVIELDQNYEYGVTVADTLINNGKLTINQGSESGIYVNSAPSLIVNNTNGKISIDNIKNGIYLLGEYAGINTDTTRFRNMGRLEISNSYEKAIFADHDSRIDNYDTLMMQNSFSGIYNTTYFENHPGGFISIDTIYGTGSLGYAITNKENFKNSSCAKIKLDGAINNNFSSDNFINEGIMIQYSNISNVFTIPVTNRGIFSNVLGATTDTLNMNNTGCYFKPISGTYSCGDVVPKVYIGNAAGVTGTMTYEDSLGMSSSGSINIPTKSLTLNNQNNVLNRIYANLTINGCSAHIPISFENNIASCNSPSCATNTWLGSAANQDWFTGLNWTDGVPTSCQSVIIPNGAAVNIPNGTMGECKFLEVATGVIFNVEGLLTVHGN